MLQVDPLASGASLFWPQSGRPRATKSREVYVPRHMKSDEGLFLKVYKKWLEKRVTKFRLYGIVLNDSRLWGRVKNVEEIFDIHYMCIVNISNQISKLWPEANKMAIYKEELNSG